MKYTSLGMHLKILFQLLRPGARKGQTLVEYGLILALVSIVVIAILSIMGNKLKNIFNLITNTLGPVGS